MYMYIREMDGMQMNEIAGTRSLFVEATQDRCIEVYGDRYIGIDTWRHTYKHIYA